MGFWDKLFGSSSQPTSAPQKFPEKPWYTTSLRMTVPTQVGPSMLFCNDGIVYDSATPNENNAIGFYTQTETGEWNVFCDSKKECLIGNFNAKPSDDFYIYLTLHGKVKLSPWLHTKAAGSLHGFLWCAAECWVSGEKMIADRESYESLGRYQGDPIEAAAAFIAWAYESWGNKYNDYYRI